MTRPGPPAKPPNPFAEVLGLSIPADEVLKKLRYQLPHAIQALCRQHHRLPVSSNRNLRLASSTILTALSQAFHKASREGDVLPSGLDFAALRNTLATHAATARTFAQYLDQLRPPATISHPIPPSPHLTLVPRPRKLEPLEFEPSEIAAHATHLLDEYTAPGSPSNALLRRYRSFRIDVIATGDGVHALPLLRRLHLEKIALEQPEWGAIVPSGLHANIQALIEKTGAKARKPSVSSNGSRAGAPKPTAKPAAARWYHDPLTVIEYTLGLSETWAGVQDTPELREWLFVVLDNDIRRVEEELERPGFAKRHPDAADLLQREFMKAARRYRKLARPARLNPTRSSGPQPAFSDYTSGERDLILRARGQGEWRVILPDTGERVYLRDVRSPLAAIREAVSARADEFARSGVWWPQLGAFVPTTLAPTPGKPETADIRDVVQTALADLDLRWDAYVAAQKAARQARRALPPAAPEDTDKGLLGRLFRNSDNKVRLSNTHRRMLHEHQAKQAKLSNQPRPCAPGQPGPPAPRITEVNLRTLGVDELLQTLDPAHYHADADGELVFTPTQLPRRVQESKPTHGTPNPRDLGRDLGITRDGYLGKGDEGSYRMARLYDEAMAENEWREKTRKRRGLFAKPHDKAGFADPSRFWPAAPEGHTPAPEESGNPSRD